MLLASEGRAIPPAAVDRAAELARESGGSVHVFSIARVWGTSLGFPNPGPAAEQARVESAARRGRGRREGARAAGGRRDGHVLGTRKATKRIVAEAERLGCTAIVMAADPPRNRIVADLMWSQEPYRVQRRAKVPVHLVRPSGLPLQSSRNAVRRSGSRPATCAPDGATPSVNGSHQSSNVACSTFTATALSTMSPIPAARKRSARWPALLPGQTDPVST